MGKRVAQQGRFGMSKFLFDVDGTLTPSRCTMDPGFAGWFTEFAQNNDVYLVTGSDYPKTVEQVGHRICNTVKRVYNCSGNDVYERGVQTHFQHWQMPPEQYQWLQEQMDQSEFELRTGQHFEHRTGTVNFSVVGRGADAEQRELYVKWDKQTKERTSIAKQFEKLFPGFTASVGGDTGIDIYPNGMDKSQVLADFAEDDVIYFFGDKTSPGGNDFPIAKELENVYNVQSWQETYNRLLLMKVMGLIQ